MGLEQSFNNELSTNKAESNVKSWGEILKTQQKINKTLNDLKNVEEKQETLDNNEVAELLKLIENNETKNTTEIIKNKIPLEQQSVAANFKAMEASNSSFWNKLGFGNNSKSKQNIIAMNNIMDESINRLGASSMNALDQFDDVA